MKTLRNFSLGLFADLSPAELARYKRQLLLENWGLGAQQKLKASKVLVAGSSGILTAAAFDLVTSGVGFLKIIDESQVSSQDLDDQLIYQESDLNKSKALILRQRLQEANPFSCIAGREGQINDQDADNLTQKFDLILADLNEAQNASVLNRVAIRCQIPLLLSWTRGMRGYITTLKPGEGLCLECTPLTEWASTSDTSFLTPMSAIVGGLIALEALRILGGWGPILLGRLFAYDGDLCQCLEKPIRRQKECRVCS